MLTRTIFLGAHFTYATFFLVCLHSGTSTGRESLLKDDIHYVHHSAFRALVLVRDVLFCWRRLVDACFIFYGRRALACRLERASMLGMMCVPQMPWVLEQVFFLVHSGRICRGVLRQNPRAANLVSSKPPAICIHSIPLPSRGLLLK